MRNDLTNLLPPERQRALSREYFLRLGVVGIIFATILVLIAVALLSPTYVFLSKSARAKEVHLATIESALSVAGEASLAARLAELSGNMTALVSLTKTQSVSAIIRSALDISRPGIVLSGFVYTPVQGKNPGTLTLSGTAATRDALRGYQLALSAAQFALAANLPVSAYAKDSNIAFTITVTLSP